MADTIQAVHFVDEQPSATQTVVQVYADNLPSGGTAYTLPAATESALGGVKLAKFGDAIGNANEAVAAAAGDAPTKAEFDALQASYNALAKQFNRLISGLANAGTISKPSA